MYSCLTLSWYRNIKMAASRVKRTGALKETGYYRILCGENEETNSAEEDSLVLTDNDVFEVERLVEKRIRKVNRH